MYTRSVEVQASTGRREYVESGSFGLVPTSSPTKIAELSYIGGIDRRRHPHPWIRQSNHNLDNTDGRSLPYRANVREFTMCNTTKKFVYGQFTLLVQNRSLCPFVKYATHATSRELPAEPRGIRLTFATLP